MEQDQEPTPFAIKIAAKSVFVVLYLWRLWLRLMSAYHYVWDHIMAFFILLGMLFERFVLDRDPLEDR